MPRSPSALPDDDVRAGRKEDHEEINTVDRDLGCRRRSAAVRLRDQRQQQWGRSWRSADRVGGRQPEADQLHQQDEERRAAGHGVGVVPEHGQRRRQLQRRAQRRPGLLDQRRPGQRRVQQVPDGDLGREGAPDVVMLEADRLASFAIQDALVDLSPSAPTRSRPTSAKAPGRTSRRATGGLRHPGRRRPDGHDLPHRHLREVRHHRLPTTWEEFAAAAAEGQGCRRPALR